MMLQIPNRLLIVSNDPSVHKELKQELQASYEILTATTLQEVIEQAHKTPTPVCIIIDHQPPTTDALTITHEIKAHFTTYHIPVIIITKTVDQSFVGNAVHVGADDFIQNPLLPHHLQSRIFMNIQRAERDQNANPLTKLPGNATINRLMVARLGRPLAILYIDLDYFKVYNDTYGFDKGDALICAAAHIISTATQQHGNTSDFVGHLGGDDFIVLSTPCKAIAIAHTICSTFDATVPSFYDIQAQQQKTIRAKDRQGVERTFPLTSISIAIISNEHQPFYSIAHISQQATELKKYAKSKPDGIQASNYVTERRA